MKSLFSLFMSTQACDVAKGEVSIIVYTTVYKRSSAPEQSRESLHTLSILISHYH